MPNTVIPVMWMSTSPFDKQYALTSKLMKVNAFICQIIAEPKP
jgi:hypothetical protein